MSTEREALVLLPGFLCDQSYWQDQIDALSDVAACSCAEYGMLDSLPAMAESVLRGAPKRFSLAGHSMGGRIALEVFRKAPERVKRLALFNTGATPRAAGAVGEEEERGRRRLPEIAQSQGMRAMALEWIPDKLAPARRSDAVLTEAIVRMFERKTPQIFEAQMNALLGRPDAIPLLGRVSCPTLVLTGQEDGWSTPAAHQQIAAAIPNSRLVLVPGSGHMSTMERPAEVSEAMRSWLEN
jgi:pimeloyl-ACP methyl ester carboxylesterase